MLHRKTDRGIYAISQPAHSWVSGQLARAWGNSQFPPPSEAVILAAALHDIGFLDWENKPTLNPETGLPHTFMDLPTPLHLQLWEKGVDELLHLNRYSSLLVSLHNTGLTQRHPADTQEDRALQSAFLQRQQNLQCELISTLFDPRTVEHDRPLVPLWDWMSLILGLHETSRISIDDVPTRGTPVKLLMDEYQPGKYHVGPWPFREECLTVSFQVRLLVNKYSTESQMRHALQAAPTEDLHIELRPL